MAKRLEKNALKGAFTRGKKPELEFLIPRRGSLASPPPAEVDEPTVVEKIQAPEPIFEELSRTLGFTRILQPEHYQWTPGAPPIRRGLRARLERRWDGLLRGLLRCTLGWV